MDREGAAGFAVAPAPDDEEAGDPVVEDAARDVCGSGTGKPGFGGGATVTLFVTVTAATSLIDPLHADSRHAEIVTTATASRFRLLNARRLTKSSIAVDWSARLVLTQVTVLNGYLKAPTPGG